MDNRPVLNGFDADHEKERWTEGRNYDSIYCLCIQCCEAM